MFVYVCAKSLQLCPTLFDPMNSTRLLCPWGFSRQEYWSGVLCPPPEAPWDFTNWGTFQGKTPKASLPHS